MSDSFIEVNAGLLMAGRSHRGGWTREQFELLGVAWPPASGWREEVIGTRIPLEAAQRFVSTRETRYRPRKGRNQFLGMLH
jgi:hypothetical protein